MILTGDCLEVMETFPDNHFSSVVTDPPYGLSFMGKGWDHEVPGVEYWKSCLRLLKPGGFLLAMGGTRTFHRLASCIEDSGFSIRDTIYWIYGSGFPKSHNNFGIKGYGSALKPAVEPCILAMKPCDGTFKQNVEKWGQAGINIDACRIPTDDTLSIGSSNMGYHGTHFPRCNQQNSKGRWPANLILDSEAGAMLDEQSGFSKSVPFGNPTCGFHDSLGRQKNKRNEIGKGHSDSGGASRFFYTAKASPRERNEGLDKPSSHPTVKPLALMEYLIKLIAPPNALILDPFAGSGTTIVAATNLGIKAIGIEKEAEYAEIARARVENALKKKPEDQQMDFLQETAR
jgi:DNA modification methylase